jgi:hypothetical protein
VASGAPGPRPRGAAGCRGARAAPAARCPRRPPPAAAARAATRPATRPTLPLRRPPTRSHSVARPRACAPLTPNPQIARAAAVEAEPEFDYKTRQYDPKELSSVEQDPEMLKLPAGYHWYETMLVLKGTLGDEER